MQEVTVSKFKRALSMIVDYKPDEIGLSHLLGALEGTLRSMEEPLPQEFLAVWHDAFFNLETIYALGKENILVIEVRKELGRLEILISNFLAQ